MQTLKIWQLLVLTFSAYLYGFAMSVEIRQCIHAVKDEPCNMTCQVPDFTEAIFINCNGTSRGACITIGCGANMYQEGGNIVYLQIPSLSYTSDNCGWTCTYGATSSSSLTYTIYSGISNVNLTSQEMNAGGVKLTAIAECLYPSNPIVDVMYSIERAGPYVSLTQQVYLQSSTTPGGCSYAIESRVTAISDVPANHADLEGKSVFFKMKFKQYLSGPDTYTSEVGPFSFKGPTTPSSTISSNLPTTVSEVPPPSVTTSSAGLSQEMVITIVSSILAAGVLIFLIVLIVKLCRKKDKKTPAKNKENCFANKQCNFTKKDAFKSSIEPRKPKLLGKRNAKQESFSLNEFQHTQFNNSEAPKDRMYEHYPQTTDYMYWNNSGNQHVFNHSHAERSMVLYGNQHDRYSKSHSGSNNRMLYQSRYPEHPGHNEGIIQYYRANNLYQGQQMYQKPYVAQYDHHIKNKPENKRSFEGRTYERNWDFLY